MSHLTSILFDIDFGLFIVEIHNCYKKRKHGYNYNSYYSSFDSVSSLKGISLHAQVHMNVTEPDRIDKERAE